MSRADAEDPSLRPGVVLESPTFVSPHKGDPVKSAPLR
jgi:hypothetical protein